MPDKKLTDNEIIKALECCVSEKDTCQNCPFQELKHYDYENEMFEIMPNGKQYDDWSCERWLNVAVLDLITRQQAIVEKSEKVEYFADKTIATLQAENKDLAETIHNLTIEKDALFDKAEELKAEVERLEKESNDKERAYTDEYCLRKEWQRRCRELLEEKQNAKSEAVKEFAENIVEKVEKARQKYQRLCKEQGEEEDEAMNIHFRGMINLVKEMVGEDDGKK